MASGILSQVLDKIKSTTTDDFQHQIVGRYNNEYESNFSHGKHIYVSNSQLSRLYQDETELQSLNTDHKLAICLSSEFIHKLLIDVDCCECKKNKKPCTGNYETSSLPCIKIIYKYVLSFFNIVPKTLPFIVTRGNSCGFHLIFFTINIDHIVYQIFLTNLLKELVTIGQYQIDQGLTSFSLPNGNGHRKLYYYNTKASKYFVNLLPIIVNLKENLNSTCIYGIDQFFACNDLDFQKHLANDQLYCLNPFFVQKEEDLNFFCSVKLYTSAIEYYNYYQNNVKPAIDQYKFPFTWKIEEKFNYWSKIVTNKIENSHQPIITTMVEKNIQKYSNVSELFNEENDRPILEYDKKNYTNRLVTRKNNHKVYFVDEPICEPKFDKNVRFDLKNLVSYKLYKAHQLCSTVWDNICQLFYNEYLQISYHRVMCNYLIFDNFLVEQNDSSPTEFVNSILQLALNMNLITGCIWDLWMLILNNKVNMSNVEDINEVIDYFNDDDVDNVNDTDNNITIRHLIAGILENAPSKNDPILLYYYHYTEKAIMDELLDSFKTCNVIKFIYSLFASKYLEANPEVNDKVAFSTIHFEIYKQSSWPNGGGGGSPETTAVEEEKKKGRKKRESPSIYSLLKAHYYYCFKYDEQKFFYNGVEYVDEKNFYNEICEHVKWEEFKVCKTHPWKCLPAIPYIYPTNLKNGHFSLYFNLITHSFETASGGIATLLVRNFEPNEHITKLRYIDQLYFQIKDLLFNGLTQLQEDINYSVLHVIIKHSLFPIEFETDERLNEMYNSNVKKYQMTISINDYRHLFQIFQNEDYNFIRQLLSVDKIGEILNWIIVVITYVCSTHKINYKLIDYKTIFHALFGDETNSIVGIPTNNFYNVENKKRKHENEIENVKKLKTESDDNELLLFNPSNQNTHSKCSIYSFHDLCKEYSNESLSIITLPDCIQETEKTNNDEETECIIPTYCWTKELSNCKNFTFLNSKSLPTYIREAFKNINNNHVNFLPLNIDNAQFIPNEVLLNSFIVTIHLIKRLNWYGYKKQSPWPEENEAFPNIITSNLIANRNWLIEQLLNLVAYKWPFDFYIDDYSKRTQVFIDYFKNVKMPQYPYLECTKKIFLNDRSKAFTSCFRPIMEALSYLIYMSGFNNNLLYYYLKIIHSIDWPGQWPKKMFLLFGEANAGKSKFAEILQLYGSKADTLNDIDSQVKNNKPETVIYYNNFLAIIEEISRLPTDFKRIISEAAISYRKNLGNNFMRGFALCKIFSTCNRIPPIDSDEEALFKRILVCPINHKHQDSADGMELKIRFMNSSEQILWINKIDGKKKNLIIDKALPFIGLNKFESIFPKSITHNRDIVLGLQLISFYFTYFYAFRSFTDPVNLSNVPLVCEDAHADWLAKFSAYHKWKNEYKVTANDNVYTNSDNSTKGISVTEIDKSFTDFCARNGKIAEKDKLWTWFEREFGRYKTTEGNYDITINAFI
jgi:hypothetical protein